MNSACEATPIEPHYTINTLLSLLHDQSPDQIIGDHAALHIDMGAGCVRLNRLRAQQFLDVIGETAGSVNRVFDGVG